MKTESANVQRSVGIPRPKRWTLRDQVGLWLLAVTAGPLLLLAWLYPSLESRNIRALQRERMEATAETTASALDQFLIIHLAAIEYLADQLGEPRAPPANDASELAELRYRYPSFFSLLRTDAQGRVVAVNIGGDNAVELAASTLGIEVNDRSYFLRARASGRGFVSEAFRGRLGNEVIVAMSAPVADSHALFQGVVQGVLRLDAFAAITARLGLKSEEMSLDIYDQQLRLVYSTGSAPETELQQMPAPIAAALGLRERVENNGRGRPQLAAAMVGDTGWRVVVRSPGVSLAHLVDRLYLVTALALTLGLALIFFAINRVAATVARPLETIKRDLDELDLNQPHGAALHALPDSASIEVHAIREGFTDLLLRLDAANHARAEALAAKDLINADLAQVLAERDAHIERQTADLKHALSLAEAAGVAKDRLLANTSHEIRTPLNGIIGSAELLLHGQLDAGQRRKLTSLLRSAESLLALLNDLLDLARAQQSEIRLRRESFALQDELEAIVESLAALAQKRGLELTLALHPGLPEHVEGDSLRLRQVLLNLVGNAIKFTESGSVRIDVEPGSDGRTRFTVTDTGIGIATGDLGQVFEPFVQVESSPNRRFTGSGLGLAITRHLLELMGAQIEVASTPGVGSRFWFEVLLPAATAAATASTAGSAADAPAITNACVLVVDDVDINRDLAVAQLGLLGIAAQAAASGPEALELLVGRHFDLVLLDCQMPGMDGFETAARIRALKLDPPPRIIALTANAQASEREHSLAAGMDGHLVKPLRLKVLRETLREAGVL